MQFKHSITVFASIWSSIMILTVSAILIGNPGGFGASNWIWSLMLLLTAIAGTTAVLLYCGSKSRKHAYAMAALAVFITTPASSFYYMPMPFFFLLMDGLFGGQGFGEISDTYWSQPLSTACALGIILSAGAVLSLVIVGTVLHLTAWLDKHTRHFLTWLLPFPVFIIEMVLFQMLMLVVLLLVYNMGIYPIF